jgi:hypothetical protein
MAAAVGPRSRSPRNTSTGLIVGLGLALLAVYVVALFLMMDETTWDAWGAMLIGPLMFVASLPAFARQARREGERRIFWFLVAALVVKMLFSLVRYYHAFHIVDRADAQAYDRVGTNIAMRFLNGNYDTGLNGVLDSDFIRLLTGLIYTVIRPSVVSGFLIYAWLAFWGSYFFYRAFVLAVPEGNRRSYARWLFFMPSMLFWPSSIGKEAWLLFGLGIAAFGAAKALTGRTIPGVVISGLGIGLASLVRAPIPVLLGIGLVVGGMVRRQRANLGYVRPIAKVAGVAFFAALAIVLVIVFQGYIVRNTGRAQGGGGFDALVRQSVEQTSQGGSEFRPAPITSPAGLVLAPVTVMFRPFLFETPPSPEGIVTALESTLLLIWSIVRFRSFLAAIRSIRRVPYVAVALVYVVGSIVALSAVANFGIIVRQRTLIIPMYLVLMCFLSRRSAPHGPRARSEPAIVGGHPG